MPFGERQVFKSGKVKRPELLLLGRCAVPFERNRIDEQCIMLGIKDMRRKRHRNVVVGSRYAFLERDSFEEELIGGHMVMIERGGEGSTALLKSFHIVSASLYNNLDPFMCFDRLGTNGALVVRQSAHGWQSGRPCAPPATAASRAPSCR